MADKIKIVFMGTPEFAVASLNVLVKNHYEIAAVITTPDKPAGRGLAMQESAVKKYARKNNILTFQPESLKDDFFIKTLKEINADLYIVVAFRMLPETVWRIPRLGTFNLHASLLPDYRGAAPINHAIINGEKETGITTFFINQEIDKGSILFRETVSIGETESAGELHDRLMDRGALLVLKTVKAISEGNFRTVMQESLFDHTKLWHSAPKIFKSDCRINWNKPVKNIFDFIRGLSPYPAAFTEFISPENITYTVKIFKASFLKEENTNYKPGDIITDGKEFVKISARDGFIIIEDLQLSGKKRMLITTFLMGFAMNNQWKALIQ